MRTVKSNARPGSSAQNSERPASAPSAASEPPQATAARGADEPGQTRTTMPTITTHQMAMAIAE